MWKCFTTLAKICKTTELLKPLLQIKTENSQWEDNETIKEDTNFKVQRQEPIDSFIDHLTEGQETKLLKCNKEIDAETALKLEFESCSLPVVPLFLKTPHFTPRKQNKQISF